MFLGIMGSPTNTMKSNFSIFQHCEEFPNKSWLKYPNFAQLKKVFIASNHSFYACPEIPGMVFALPEIKLFVISVSLLPSLPIVWF